MMSQPKLSTPSPTHLTERVYKSQLQELCQKRHWPLPEYTTSKEGPLHNLYFKSTVHVNGQSFQTTEGHKRSKDAQMDAARIALAHFTARPEQAPVAEVRIDSTPVKVVGGISGITICTKKEPMIEEIKVPTVKEEDQTPASDIIINVNKRPVTEEFRTPLVQLKERTPEAAPEAKRNKHSEELHQYKNLLQSFAVKKGFDLPKYSCQTEGPPHDIRFKSKVLVDGQTYESPDFFGTLKDSEHAAAKVAMLSLAPDQSQDNNGDKPVYKNLLQELAQKSGINLPIYDTYSSGASHMPTFVSTVKVGTDTFSGEIAKTKKLAEMNAAKVAYTYLRQGKNLGSTVSSTGCTQKQASCNVSAVTTTDSQQCNKLDLSSKLNLGQGCSWHTEGVGQEASKQISAFSGTSSSSEDCSGHQNVDRNTQMKLQTPSHVEKKQRLDGIPLPNVEANLLPVPSEASQSTDAEYFSGPNSARCNVVRVYPRVPNMQFPTGAVVQHSDDKWVSVKFPVNQMGN